MNSASPRILSLNGGSSSIKFALYQAGAVLDLVLGGQIDRIGQGYSQLSFTHRFEQRSGSHGIGAADHRGAVTSLMNWLASKEGLGSIDTIDAIGHRVVHGMAHTEPVRVSPELLEELRGIALCDPDHLPGEIALIEAFGQSHPELRQVACFDTAFHHGMPRVARLLAIPRRFEAKGLRRYGFHGLSYAYLMEELARLDGASAAQGRIVLAHLGSGASMAAVKHGKSMDTSMGFTPTGGLPMATRSGDLDPGLAAYLASSEQMNGAEFHDMVNHDSGLLGISETSGDIRDLLEREAGDVRAAEALALFCYEVKKRIGAYAAALGGIDTLVFAGGIGENAAPIRERVCEGLGFLGITIDPARNATHAGVISAQGSKTMVRVIRTDEERMIARSVCRVLGLGACAPQAQPAAR